MFDLIEKLRQKSPGTKKAVAFFSALFLSGIIFVVWLSVIYPDFKQDRRNKEKILKLEPSPLGTFGETLKMGLSAIGVQINEMKESITSLSSSSAYYYSTTTDPLVWVSATTTNQLEATSTPENPDDQIPASDQ